jgi:transcriptional regulator with XRE-family HTH domain
VVSWPCHGQVIDSSAVTREEQHVAEAIKALRAEFGESQQRFSDRIGVVVRTVARYEVQKPPTGEMLSKLAALADEVGRPDLRVVFTDAFWRELNEEIESKLQIQIPRMRSHYKALLWLIVNGGSRSQSRMDIFLKEEIARVAKERKRELSHEERQDLGSLVGGSSE